MEKLKCIECGKVFEATASNCPECGCPASECETIIEQQEPTTNNQEEEISKEKSLGTSATKESNRMYACLGCGKIISETALRCPHCGAKGKYAPMDFGDAIYDCFCRKYFCFSGRSRRSEVFPFLILVGMMCGTLIYFKTDGAPAGGPSPEWLPFLITFFPCLGAIIRRLHDIGRSGWWVICPIIPEFFFFKDSDKGENEYGKSPKYQPEFFTEKLPDNGTKIATYIMIVLVAIIILFLLIYSSQNSHSAYYYY